MQSFGNGFVYGEEMIDDDFGEYGIKFIECRLLNLGNYVPELLHIDFQHISSGKEGLVESSVLDDVKDDLVSLFFLSHKGINPRVCDICYRRFEDSSYGIGDLNWFKRNNSQLILSFGPKIFHEGLGQVHCRYFTGTCTYYYLSLQLLPTDHLESLWPRRDASDLFVASIHGARRWCSVGDVGSLGGRLL
nr:hypothetical protein [Tanacetum cinerariifolium]